MMRLSLTSLLLAGVLVTVGATGCSGASTATVTLDIYSGRENPSWELSEETRDQLVDAIDGLEEGVSEIPTGLGFRGFRVSSLTTKWGDGTPLTIVEGVVVVDPDSAEPTILIDDRSRVLELLVEDAKGHVDDDTLEAIREIGS